MKLLRAIGMGLCPRCRKFQIFRSLWVINERCSQCGLRFEREPGYFLGAMMLSYGISVMAYVPLYLFLKYAVGMNDWKLYGLMLLMYLPIVPVIFRYSRIIWIYFDQTIDPERL